VPNVPSSPRRRKHITNIMPHHPGVVAHRLLGQTSGQRHLTIQDVDPAQVPTSDLADHREARLAVSRSKARQSSAPLRLAIRKVDLERSLRLVVPDSHQNALHLRRAQTGQSRESLHTREGNVRATKPPSADLQRHQDFLPSVRARLDLSRERKRRKNVMKRRT
jgi:hypothetical protein